MKHHQMRDMTVEDVNNYLKNNSTIIIPYALCEQHGYHLPLDVDLKNAEHASIALAQRLDCIIAPVLNYSFSGGMSAGTINIKPNTFANMIGEIIESLSVQGFKNFIIISGHGGTESFGHLRESLRVLKWLNPGLRDALVLLVAIWDFSPTWRKLFEERDFHAAQAETSLMLHWAPEVVRAQVLVDRDEIAESLRQNPDNYQLRESFTHLPQEIIQTSQRSEVEIGVMGYPEKATATLGAKIEAEFIENASIELGKAIEIAEESRRSGGKIQHEIMSH